MLRRAMIPTVTAVAAVCQTLAAHSNDLTIPVPATDVQQTRVSYSCDSEAPMTVTYINAGQNSLAVVPIDGQLLVFASVISGSGARYAAGPYIWWSHQGEATLSDVRNSEDAKPITCKKAD